MGETSGMWGFELLKMGGSPTLALLTAARRKDLAETVQCDRMEILAGKAKRVTQRLVSR